MASYQRPRLFRSDKGCCICRTKSSTSRFVPAHRYSHSFKDCFKVETSLDTRYSGEICNACVLHVKRFRGGKRTCEHVVDSRLKPGMRPKLNRHRISEEYVCRKHRYQSKKRAGSIESDEGTSDRNRTKFCISNMKQKSFFSTEHFTKTKICCGNVWTSHNSVAFDACLTRPCVNPSRNTSYINSSIAEHLNPTGHNFVVRTSDNFILDERLSQLSL